MGQPGKTVASELQREGFSRLPEDFFTFIQTFLTPYGSLGHLNALEALNKNFFFFFFINCICVCIHDVYVPGGDGGV